MAYSPSPWLQDDIGLVTHFMELDGQTLMMVNHFQVLESGSTNYLLTTQAMADALALDLAGATRWGKIVERQTTELRYTRVQVQRIWPLRDIYLGTDIDQAGAAVGLAPPPNIALTLNKRTALPGKRGHGTIHIPGLVLGNITDGLWNEAFFEGVQEDVDEYLRAPYDVGAFDMALEWGIANGELPGISFEPIVQVLGTRRVTTMHRRTVGLGI